MKTALFLVAFLCAAGCASQQPVPFTQGNARYHFLVLATQAAGQEAATEVSATVTDLATKKNITISPFRIAPAETTERTAVDDATGTRLELSATADETASRVRYVITLRKSDGALIASEFGSTER